MTWTIIQYWIKYHWTKYGSTGLSMTCNFLQGTWWRLLPLDWSILGYPWLKVLHGSWLKVPVKIAGKPLTHPCSTRFIHFLVQLIHIFMPKYAEKSLSSSDPHRLAFYLTYTLIDYLTSYLASILAFYLTFWHIFRHVVGSRHAQLHPELAIYRSGPGMTDMTSGEGGKEGRRPAIFQHIFAIWLVYSWKSFQDGWFRGPPMLRNLHLHISTMWGPPVISWLTKAPVTIVICVP